MKENLWLLKQADRLDRQEFLDLFKGSTLENVPRWYPELSPEEGLQKYEDGFWEYMTGPFYAEGGILAILRDEEHYRSSLRMYPYRDGWLIEGFETRPDSRKKGFGRRLYKMLMERLEQDGDIVLYAYTGKKNAASIAAHQSAGFERVCEYWEEDDGTRNEKEVTLIYRTAKK